MRNKPFIPNERWCFPEKPPSSRLPEQNKPWCYPERPPGDPDEEGCFPESPGRRRRRPFGLEDLARLL
jgi:hypothetical protein